MPELSDIDRRILATLQGDFPICERPYAEAAAQLGIGEAELLARLESLLADKVLTRFGPMFQIEEMGGAFVLAALAVPEARYEEVTALVNALPQVAHNYRREHQGLEAVVLVAQRLDADHPVVAVIDLWLINQVQFVVGEGFAQGFLQLAAGADLTQLLIEKHKLRGADGRNATVSIARMNP